MRVKTSKLKPINVYLDAEVHADLVKSGLNMSKLVRHLLDRWHQEDFLPAQGKESKAAAKSKKATE